MTEHMNARTVNSLRGASKGLGKSLQKFGAKEKALERTCLAAIKEPRNSTDIVFSNGVCDEGYEFPQMDISKRRTKRAQVFNRKCREDSSVCEKVYHADDEDALKVNIQEGTIMIGPGAFESSEIKEIIIPNTVTNIGERAFEYCNLKRVVLPESVKIIQAMAFASCNNLEEVIIPKGISHIGYSAFDRCPNLNLIFQNDVPNLSRGIQDFVTSNGLHKLKQITFRINFKELPEFQLPFGTVALPIHKNNLN